MEFAARILGTGSAYPEKRLTNDDIARKIAEFGIETSDQWIRDRTGIRERRVADKENGAETNSSLGAEAARKALSMAGKTADEIDQIIYATFTPDTIIPSTACWLQQKIGAGRAWAMDINAACSGFVTHSPNSCIKYQAPTLQCNIIIFFFDLSIFSSHNSICLSAIVSSFICGKV